jgi:hypothetical protein
MNTDPSQESQRKFSLKDAMVVGSVVLAVTAGGFKTAKDVLDSSLDATADTQSLQVKQDERTAEAFRDELLPGHAGEPLTLTPAPAKR